MENSEREPVKEYGKSLASLKKELLEPEDYLFIVTSGFSRLVFYVYKKEGSKVFIKCFTGAGTDLEEKEGELNNDEIVLGMPLSFGTDNTSEVEQIIILDNPILIDPEPIEYDKSIDEVNVLSLKEGNVIHIKTEDRQEYKFKYEGFENGLPYLKIIQARDEDLVGRHCYYIKPFIRKGYTFKTDLDETHKIAKIVGIIIYKDIEEEPEDVVDDTVQESITAQESKRTQQSIEEIFKYDFSNLNVKEKDTLEMFGLNIGTITEEGLRNEWIKFDAKYGSIPYGVSRRGALVRKIAHKHVKAGYEALLERFK